MRFTPREYAGHLKKTHDTILRWIREGSLPKGARLERANPDHKKKARWIIVVQDLPQKED